MTLVVDIGNTNIVCGVYKTDTLHWHARFKTDRCATSDQYFAYLSALKKNAWNVCDINCIVIASVVPELTRIWHHLFQKHFSAPEHHINANSGLGLSYCVFDPSFIGADLIINAFAAWKKYLSTCIVVDLGTATTIQLITNQGKFMGTVIAPGIRTAAAQLFNKAALLSEIELTFPEKTLGTTTHDALLSGIVTGHAYMIESFIQKIKAEYAELKPIVTVATGGIVDLMFPLISSIDFVDKTLTLDGLNLAAKILSQKSDL